jgi:hypothetical protein
MAVAYDTSGRSSQPNNNIPSNILTVQNPKRLTTENNNKQRKYFNIQSILLLRNNTKNNKLYTIPRGPESSPPRPPPDRLISDTENQSFAVLLERNRRRTMLDA